MIAKFKMFSLPKKIAVVFGSFIGIVIGLYVTCGVALFAIWEVQYILRSTFGLKSINYFLS